MADAKGNHRTASRIQVVSDIEKENEEASTGSGIGHRQLAPGLRRRRDKDIINVRESRQNRASNQRERLIVSVRGRETHTDIRAVSCSGRPSDKDQKEGMNVSRSGVLTCRPGINRRRKTTANGRQFIIADSQQGEKRNKERPLSIDKKRRSGFLSGGG
ncbi:predicted protein [Histoplasma capsulatum H143]|uniref:Uncharacterized protein n=1 Tax=Ajellomyces capsulatus (strain H143) TaxID=544712 RepID=C6HAC8_AJECH|nr:predicted protein [Histoplasma capsulatum H143]